MLIGQTKLKKLTDYIMKISKASETEVLVFVDESSLSRFANNQIHQNVTNNNIVVQVRSLIGKKQGVASANLSSSEMSLRAKRSNLSGIATPFGLAMTNILDKLVQQSYLIAKFSPEDPDFHHLPGPMAYQEVKAYKESTAGVSPIYRAKEIEKIIKMAKSEKLNAFGSLSSGTYEVVVANSHGVFAYYPSTHSTLNIRVMRSLSSGYAGEINSDIFKLNIEEAARRAINKTILGKKITDVEPGNYEVILEEPAISDMMTYMSYLGFGARAFHEDRSFMSGKLGQKVMGDNITIWDDGVSHDYLPMPFDYQGMPKEKVTLIENGNAQNILYDHYLAEKYKAKPTGHGYPAPHIEDAYASHLHLKPGSTPKSELLKGIKRGILVSRFWYVRNIHPKELSITGMTRDGTFLIENGEIVSGGPNMRFMISIPKILSSVTHISQETHLEPSDEGFGASLLPAIRATDFTFTGISKL